MEGQYLVNVCYIVQVANEWIIIAGSALTMYNLTRNFRQVRTYSFA